MSSALATQPAIDPWAEVEASAASAWWPDHVVPSAWIEHTPFAAWLIGAARPGTVVELGTYLGASFLAFCQAARRLDQPVRCFAVDTWQGDDHTGPYGQEIFEAVSAKATASYPDIATLLRMRFDEALGRFEDGSVDVLHIDGFHTYEAVAADFHSWLPKMSPRGIVLFHDTEVRERDFGVWRLWEELSARYPSFSFLHGHGLGVLGVGGDIPAEVAELLAARDGTADRLRALFAQRGAAVAAQLRAMSEPPAERGRNGARPPQSLLARGSRKTQLLAGAARGWRILEIGPSHAPIAPRSAGWNVTVVDHADRAGLVAKYGNDPAVDTSRIEDVDVVWTDGRLDALIPAAQHGTYDLLIASHVIEHFPDPIGVLRSAERLLRPDGGLISLAVPDKRLCFDFFRPLSTTGQLLAAYRAGRSRHSVADIFDYYAYQVGLNGNTSWGWQPTRGVRPLTTLRAAYGQFLEARDDAESPYHDCHAWMFTPASFELAILELGELGIVDWRVDRIDPQSSVEFIVHLRRGRRVFPSVEAFAAHRLELLQHVMRDLHAQSSVFLGISSAQVQSAAVTTLRRVLPVPVRRMIARLRSRLS